MGHRRSVIHAAVLLLAGLSVTAVLRRAIAPTRPIQAAVVAGPSSGALPAALPPRWSVKVDGWTIELDGVSGQRFVPPVAVEPIPAPLSPYDRIIATHAEKAGIDWRFVAAIIYEESRFDPDSVSDAGAIGLMQVMPVAAQDVGELRFREPEANVRTGVRYLQRLQREYAAARDRNQQGLMLAAYNMGVGHVRDAQTLARRFGYDPLRWDGSMDVMVSLLEEPSMYVTLPRGYAQGRGVVGYVDRVLGRYDAYRRQLPAVPPLGRTVSVGPPRQASRAADG